ncbi:MAG: hypothetical protein JWR51_2364 [Devosia sp.]|uniref:hypothetical protein n=1 Tax=Devosia sp. TaxID=1871048 RepID=UPI00262EB503|nr:hypothetical protein [Devosia sp.]MDB5529261.1 hypothetical protein [Devosia sp.]
MSGRDVVRGLRESGKLGKPAIGGGRVDLWLGVVAVVAIACCIYVGLGWLNNARPPASPLAVAHVVQADEQDAIWSDADTAKCQADARIAANEDVPGDLAMANQAVTSGGFSSMATMVACRATTKVARLCDAAQKAEFVAMVNDYVARLDLVVTGLNVQGGSIALIGGMLGVEDPASAYDLSKDDTIAYLKIYHQRVVAGIQSLAKAGLIAESDFGVFLGMGASSTTSHMFEGVTPDHAGCA